MKVRFAVLIIALALTVGSAVSASAVPIYASSLVAWSNVSTFGSGDVTGAPDGGGLWLGSSSDPPVMLGSFTVMFATPLGNGAGADLEVLDIGSSSNETFNVEVSSNSATYVLLGEFSATNNMIDFGAFAESVRYVRLTNTSRAVSADIDALWGNYGSSAVPDPGSSLLLLGIGLVGLRAWRRRSA